MTRKCNSPARGVTGILLLCICLIGGRSTRSHAQEAADLPDTPVGRCASAYFEAFNADSGDPLQAFERRYRSPSFLANHPLAERLKVYSRLRALFGHLTPYRVALSLDLQLTVLVHASDTDDALVMRFQLDTEDARHLAYITTSGIDDIGTPNEYVLRVATRAAPLDSALRAGTVQAAATALRDVYVYPVLGQQMADMLLRNHTAGAYEDLTRAGRLADRLTEDIDAVAQDLHLWIEAQNPLAQASLDPLNRTPEELRKGGFDIREAEVLPGNIGYIKFDMLFDDPEALAAFAAALRVVAGCDALILDLRDNIGGAWGTAGLLLAYLFPPGTVFGYRYDRDGRRVEAVAAADSIPGQPFRDNLPVYVLISRRTASAAEALAYTLKHAGRATLVGEVTSGAAHPSKEVVLNPSFRMSIPYLRSENLVTGTDWEGTGVTPQTEVAADQALDVAVEDARRRRIR